MWIGILAIIFYYIGYIIMYLFQGSYPDTRIFGKKLVFYDNLAIFLILPLSLLFSIWAIIKGVSSIKNKTGAVSPKVDITYGFATIFLICISFILFIVDSLSFGGPYIFFGIAYPILLVLVAIFLIFILFLFRSQSLNEKV